MIDYSAEGSPMSPYSFLTPDDQAQLRRERVTGLEADHYRLALLIAELPEDAPTAQREGMHADLDDIERRMTVHTAHGKDSGGDVVTDRQIDAGHHLPRELDGPQEMADAAAAPSNGHAPARRAKRTGR